MTLRAGFRQGIVFLFNIETWGSWLYLANPTRKQATLNQQHARIYLGLSTPPVPLLLVVLPEQIKTGHHSTSALPFPQTVQIEGRENGQFLIDRLEQDGLSQVKRVFAQSVFFGATALIWGAPLRRPRHTFSFPVASPGASWGSLSPRPGVRQQCGCAF